MKKIYILTLFLLSGVIAYGIEGDGSSGNPYYGTISNSVTWNSSETPGTIIYVGQSGGNEDLTIDDGGHLTIGGGTTIIFTQATSDLIITGTGRITAGASAGNEITFTKASGNANWGHISFQSMGAAGSSLFDHCIIEYGDVSSTSLSNRYGGGIHIDFSDLTISNCELSNNKAGWGGGIFVNSGENPAISNCLIKNNISTVVGGGIYLWDGTSSSISNCIIESNTAQGIAGGGGIWIGKEAGNVIVINSVILNNTAPDDGENLVLRQNTGTLKPQIINSIIWGSDNPIAYSNQTFSAQDFVNCAISNYDISSYTNCISINSSNTAPNGPNFVDPSGSDWSITFISPCRDAGTDTDAPATDYNGNG
ncbi:MAG: right-handed parallel beta-helix repeat-containing protein, partial [Bacteroidales bacterium]